MNDWEKVLPETLFLRIDRSLIVNLNHVGKLVTEDRDKSLLSMVGFPKPISLGRGATALLRKALRLKNQV